VPNRYHSSNQCEVRAKNAYISVVSTCSRPVSDRTRIKIVSSDTWMSASTRRRRLQLAPHVWRNGC
jgi:hypothetical protein